MRSGIVSAHAGDMELAFGGWHQLYASRLTASAAAQWTNTSQRP